jgi:competence protein ComEC
MSVQGFYAIVAGFLSGVLIRLSLPFGLYGMCMLLLLAGALIVRASVAHDRRALMLCFFILAVAGGVMRTDAAVPQEDMPLLSRVGEIVILEGVITEEPDIRDAHTRITLRADTHIEKDVRHPLAITVLAVAAPSDFALGDRIRVEGMVRIPKVFETDTGRVFEYPAYLMMRGIRAEIAYAKIERLEEGSFGIQRAALNVKAAFLRGLARALPEPHAGLAGGITVGDKQGIGEELARVFQTTSLSHIIVLSGYNITVVITALTALASSFLSRGGRFLVGVSIAVFFALITGFASASVRAAAMASIVLFAAWSGRTYLALRALALVSGGMVLANPYILLYDLGFQLSVSATLGLILFSPRLETYLGIIPRSAGLREIAATTLGAQLAVVPLILFSTGTFSLYALPANLLALVAVPYAMATSALAAVAGIFIPFLAPFFALPAYALLSYCIMIAEFFATLPFASITIPPFGVGALICFYGALLGSVMWLPRENGSQRPAN